MLNKFQLHKAIDACPDQLILLYRGSLSIMMRSLSRVEFVLGTESYPLTHEWTLYVFDARLML
jgi:hypothetical protein